MINRIHHLSRRVLLKSIIPVALPLVSTSSALAQLHIKVTGVGRNRYPIHFATFKNEKLIPISIREVAQADLERSGEFQHIATIEKQKDNLNFNSQVDFDSWKNQGVDFLVIGNIIQTSSDQFKVQFILFDCIQKKSLQGKTFNSSKKNLRLTAHKIADFIYEKITGTAGIFSTKIAYVTKNSNNNNLWIADADGNNALPVLSSRYPIISPCWSPSGRYLAYVSFEQKKPIIYIQDISSGNRKIVANFKGSNSAPAWSPDEKFVAATLTQDGVSQIYQIEISSGKTVRLTNSNSIDTEPVYSPDGKYIYFVSDRGGSPQIYYMPAKGGTATRITFIGDYNTSPDISPDGKYLTYIGRINGQYLVQLQDLANRTVSSITEFNNAESPSFAPNGKLIMFASSVKGKDVLMTVSIDAQTTIQLDTSGNILEPSWGPFLTN